MSKRSDMPSAAHSGRVDMIRALRDAAVTGLLAFGLFLPLIGFQTVTDFRNNLVLNTRGLLLLAVVIVVFIARLAYSLVIEPWLARRVRRPSIAAIPKWRKQVGKRL